jgi:hypothetical protein
MVQTRNRVSAFAVVVLLALSGAVGTSAAGASIQSSAGCSAAKKALSSAKKRHASPGQIRRLQAKVRAACR